MADIQTPQAGDDKSMDADVVSLLMRRTATSARDRLGRLTHGLRAPAGHGLRPCFADGTDHAVGKRRTR